MRSGVRLALDVGAKRIGVARCDRDGIMAVPVCTLDAEDPSWTTSVQSLVSEWDVLEVIVGNPVSLRGQEEAAAASVRSRVAPLVHALAPTPVRMVDERLSTAEAHRQLRAAGRSARTARSVIDAQAAVGILEFALEVERRTGVPAGEIA